jgi:hypothetical protein
MPGASKLTKKQKRKLEQEMAEEKWRGGSSPKVQKQSGKKAKVETISKAPPDEDSLVTKIVSSPKKAKVETVSKVPPYEDSLVTKTVSSPKKKDTFHTEKCKKKESVEPEKLLSEKIQPGLDKSEMNCESKPTTSTQVIENDSVVASGDGAGGKKKRKRKKKRKGGTGVQGEAGDEQAQGEKTASPGDKGRNPSKVKKPVVSDDRLKAYGINPKKFKFMDLQRAPKFQKQS